MYFSKTTIVSFGLLATTKLVAGHAAIIGATGDAGGQGSAIGVDPATPRDGTRRQPFQQDATRFKGDAAATCGETLGGGDNDVEAGTAAVMAQNGATLPQVSAGGQIMMTLHQVNGDGAGPYTCMIDATGTGTNWTPIQVTQNVDGNARGRNNDQQMQDLPLTAAIPAGQTCTGTVAGQSNVCMVRCENPARAGPFGGCVPVQMAGAAAAAPAAAGVAPPAGAVGTAAAAAPAAATAAAAVPAAGAANAQAAAPVAAAAPQAAGAQAAAPVAGTAGTAAAPLAATAGTANTAGALDTTGTVTGANAAAAAPVAGTANTATGANAAAVAPVAGTANAANTAGTAGTANTAAALTQRSAKKESANSPLLTDDDQEEEVELLGDDLE